HGQWLPFRGMEYEKMGCIAICYGHIILKKYGKTMEDYGNNMKILIFFVAVFCVRIMKEKIM
ncbi:MAG: hypothetical protein J6M33_04820, partial [Anaerovibrio sp.]|nr:hypothetical protein [Anaerovibrio sp.]